MTEAPKLDQFPRFWPSDWVNAHILVLVPATGLSTAEDNAKAIRTLKLDAAGFLCASGLVSGIERSSDDTAPHAPNGARSSL